MFYLAESFCTTVCFCFNWEFLILLWDLHAEDNPVGERNKIFGLRVEFYFVFLFWQFSCTSAWLEIL